MRILTISNLYPPHSLGGDELRCRETVQALRQRGHEVSVLTSRHGLGSARELPADPDVERALRLSGSHGHPFLGMRRLPGLEFHNNRVLREAVLRMRPDVVHVGNLGGISKSLTLTLQALKVPTVYAVSDHWIARSLVGDSWLRWWNRPDASLSHRLVRAVAATSGIRSRWQRCAPTNPLHHISFSRLYFSSRALREATARKGYQVEHGAIIYGGVDTTRFSGQPRSALESMHRLLCVGPLSEESGAMTALQAMIHLRHGYPGLLNFFGEGDPLYEARLRDFAAANGLRVNFCSASPEEMPEVYRQHDALLFTPEGEAPHFLTPLEAMASGLPVIGTTAGSSAELLRHGENSLTYPAGDPWELAQRVLELEARPALRAGLAAQGHAEVRERFHASRMIGQIESYLCESITTWQPAGLPHYAA